LTGGATEKEIIMKVILHGDENLEFREFSHPGLEIHPEQPEYEYSALQMFATSLAICTFSILASYGDQMDVTADDIYMTVNWRYAKDSGGIKDIDMDIHWPGLPESRLQAARRAASLCPLHQTLEKPPDIETRVANRSDSIKSIDFPG
jgi:uncharacterized OsmC-like protein